MIDLEHAPAFELRQPQRTAVVSRTEQDDLIAVKRADDVVDHARAHLHVQDPPRHAGQLRDRSANAAEPTAGRVLDHPRQLQRRERRAEWIIRDANVLGEEPAEVPRRGHPGGRAARRIVTHQVPDFARFVAVARGRSTTSNASAPAVWPSSCTNSIS